MQKSEVTQIIRKAYGAIAGQQNGCGCGCNCGSDKNSGKDIHEYANQLGYSDNELSNIPPEANLGLSCGNPTALANLKAGEVILDLGSGAGFDCFLAAAKVGATGRVIGVDMTTEMLERARAIAGKEQISNVEFRLGEIENLPVADNSVDVVISNCVINLSADKTRVFQEIYRVLKPGGRISISDLALLQELPENVRESVDAYIGCVAGAVLVDQYKSMVQTSGLQEINFRINKIPFELNADSLDPVDIAFREGLRAGQSPNDYVVRVIVEGKK